MNYSKKTRLLARLFIVIPMLWVVSPWHIVHHQSIASDTSEINGHGIFTASTKTNEQAIEDSVAADDGTIFVEGAPHCDSGPCAASVDTAYKSVHISVTSRYLSLPQSGTGALVPPLIRPPNFSSMIS
jgi:hypothetical protein